MEVISRASTFCVTLIGSHRYSRRQIDWVLSRLYYRYPMNFVMQTREVSSMRREWAVHKFLYGLGICRSRTCDTDFNSPLSVWERFVYDVLGRVIILFIK